MTSDIEYLPPPDDPVAFESLCLDLWKEIWDPTATPRRTAARANPRREWMSSDETA